MRFRGCVVVVYLGAASLAACAGGATATTGPAPAGPVVNVSALPGPAATPTPSATPTPTAAQSAPPSTPTPVQSGAPGATPTPAPTATATPTPAPTATPTHPVDSALCMGWTTQTVATGLGVLESVLIDPSGNGILLSNTSGNSVQRIASNGTVSTVASVSSPGELVALPGGGVLVSTGDSTIDAVLGTANGTMVVLNPATGAAPTYASGLTAPNGVAIDAAGNAYTTDTGTTPGTGITLVPASDPAHPVVNWAPVTDSNGIAIDNAKRLLYVDQTFSATNDIEVLSLDAPQTVNLLVSLTGIGSPVPKGLDDMILDPTGILDVAANGSGEVFRVDPATGYACLLAGGFSFTSAVALETGPPHGLLVVGFDGTVHSLIPPVPLPALRRR